MRQMQTVLSFITPALRLQRRLSTGIVCWLLVGLWGEANGQSNRITELKQQLEPTLTDTTRSRLLSELGEIYTDQSSDSCFYFLNQSLRLAQQSRNAFYIAGALYQLGRANLYYAKDEAKTTDWVRKLMSVATPQNDYLHLSHGYRLMAVVALHQHIGNLEELAAKSVEYAKKSRNPKAIAIAYNTQFEVLTTLGVTDFVRLANKLRLGMDACENQDPDFWLTQGLDYCDFLQQHGKQAEALTIARKLAGQTSKLQKKYGEFVYTNDMARLAAKLGWYERAEHMLLKAITLEKSRHKPDTLHLVFHYEDLIRVYEQQGAWQKAYRQSTELTILKLWLQQKRQTRDARLRVTQQQAAFDLHKKQVEIDLMAARQQQQRSYLLATLITALLLTGFILVQRRNQQRIERQKAELTSLNATKDKLFAILSHDLRSPVANLHNNVMLTDWGALSQDEFAQSTRSLSRDIGFVRTMLDNVLYWAVSQMKGFEPRFQTVELAPLLEEQLAWVQPIAESKAIEVKVNVPEQATLYADYNQVSIILRNLLQNALKFTNTGGVIEVGFTEKGKQQCLTIRDNGLGMDAETLKKTWMWGQMESHPGTAREQGTGLGLRLVQELTALNRGRVVIESSPGKGTSITLVFH